MKKFKARMKICSYKNCKKPYMPERPMQNVCCPMCAIYKARETREKKEAAENRKCVRESREKMKTRNDYLRDAQRDFNAYIRERDLGLPCICCNNLPYHGQLQLLSTLGGDWDAGHYRSRGAAPHLRFDERNVHAQLKHCNRYKSGNVVGYRSGLIVRIGLEALEALESDNSTRKYTIQELKEIAKTYRQKKRDLIKSRASGGANDKA